MESEEYLIHTTKYFYYPDEEDYNTFSKLMKPVKAKFKDKRTGIIKEYINFHVEEHGLKIDYKGKHRIILILITPQKVLNKPIITDSDYQKYIQEANKLLNEYIPSINVEDLELSQIHFKFDIYTSYKQEYINLISKMKSCHYGSKIVIHYNKDNLNVIDSVYFKSSGFNLNLYLKEREQPDNPEYKDLLRLEIQLKRPKLKQILKTKYIHPEIINYFTEAERLYFMETILQYFIYSGDYYSIRRSCNLLRRRYNNKPTMVRKLIQFQKHIAKHGITKAIEFMGICSQTTRQYIKLLEEAGINPIPLDGCSITKVNYLPSLFTGLYSPDTYKSEAS